MSGYKCMPVRLEWEVVSIVRSWVYVFLLLSAAHHRFQIPLAVSCSCALKGQDARGYFSQCSSSLSTFQLSLYAFAPKMFSLHALAPPSEVDCIFLLVCVRLMVETIRNLCCLSSACLTQASRTWPQNCVFLSIPIPAPHVFMPGLQQEFPTPLPVVVSVEDARHQTIFWLSPLN